MRATKTCVGPFTCQMNLLDDLKVAKNTPVYKKSNSSDLSHCIPLFALMFSSKIFERNWFTSGVFIDLPKTFDMNNVFYLLEFSFSSAMYFICI